MATSKPVGHIVADSGAFIRNAPLREIGEAVYTVQEVVREIRDKATRERLQVLPYKLVLREPSGESIKFVTDFAKKTGDYGVLSHVDVKVLALTYQLEREKVGKDHIKQEPDTKKEWSVNSGGREKPTEIVGFYVPRPKKLEESQEAAVVRNEDLEEEEDDGDNEESSKNEKDGMEEENKEDEEDDGDNEDSTKDEKDVMKEENKEEEIGNGDNGDKAKNEKEGMEDENKEEEEMDDDNEDGEEEEEEDEGWITPGNIRELTAKCGNVDVEKACVAVGCLTTDFAMQNVLIQMGLNVISVDGLLIRRARSYAKRCYSCMKITTNMAKEFCPHCGYKTLHRISMSVREDGSIQYFLPRKIRRTRQGALPMFRGGKYSNNPVIAEDQPMPQQRLSRKAQQRMNVMDADFLAGSSPFATHDTTSRAARLGLAKNRWNKRNPNVIQKGKRK